MDLKQFEKMINDLYGNLKGTEISISERRSKAIESNTFVYGEAVLDSLSKIFSIVNPQKDEVFCDLGSGLGKVILFAAMMYPFKECLGIELLENLHQKSVEIRQSLSEKYEPDWWDGREPSEIKLIQGDFLQYDTSDVDILYSCSTCFDEEMMKNISRKAGFLKPGSRVVTLSKGLTSDKLKLIHEEDFPMSWGKSHVFIYQVS